MFLVRPFPHHGFRESEREGTRMDEGWFERLSEVMSRMAGGDTAALEALYVGFGDPIRSLIRQELRRLGVAAADPAEILFEVKMQANHGDPSPAVTVARAKALRPESVRQTCKRLLDRVARLAATDPYFAPLADLQLLRRAS